MKMVIRRWFDVTVNTKGCNLQCEYCVRRQAEYEYKNQRALPYPIETVLEAFSKKRLGGECVFALVGDGETLLPTDIVPLVKGLIREGHYVEIVTNGTLIERVRNIVEEAKEINLEGRLLFSLSLHYTELKRLNLLKRFSDVVQYLKDSGVSLVVTMVLGDSYIEQADEILDFCNNEIKIQPMVSTARTESLSKTYELYTKYSQEEYFEAGDKFHSRCFEIAKNRYLSGKAGVNGFCYAGDWFMRLNISDGTYWPCDGNAYIKKNLYENLEHEISLRAIGNNCKMPYCVCGYAENCNLIPDKIVFEHVPYSENTNKELEFVNKEAYEVFFQCDLSTTNSQYSTEEKQNINEEVKKSSFFSAKSELMSCCVRDGLYDEAIKIAEEILVGELDNNNLSVVNAIVQYGYALMKKSRYVDALGLESCWEDLSYHADYCNMIGLAYMRVGRIEDAERVFEDAKKAHTAFSKNAIEIIPNYYLGVIYECMGENKKAIDYYRQCKDYEPARKQLNALKNM